VTIELKLSSSRDLQLARGIFRVRQYSEGHAPLEI
jgi:hypothetical protein